MSMLPTFRTMDRDPAWDLQKDMNRLFDAFFGRSVPVALWADHETSFLPPVDVHETNDKVIVEAELPGIEPKDVDIRVEGDSLFIRGERKHEKDEKEKGYHRVERVYGRFERTVELPQYADAAKCEASYKNGVLTVELPKKEEAKPRTVQVKVK